LDEDLCGAGIMPNYDLLLRDCQLPRASNVSERVDIAIHAGEIVEIAPRLSNAATAEMELEIQGHLVSPPFVESHIHLDSALTAGEPRWNQSGTLFEGIEIESECFMWT